MRLAGELLDSGPTEKVAGPLEESDEFFSSLQREDEFRFFRGPQRSAYLPLPIPDEEDAGRDALLEDFDHGLLLRNEHLAASGFGAPKTTKTGTTIVGCVYADGIVLGADTRATEGDIVADKNCAKIHFLAPNVYCCGAGTAADTEYTTAIVAGKLELHRLNEGGRASRTKTAMTLLKRYLFQYQGHVGAALVLGGCDPIDGPLLYTVYPHGSVDRLPFVSMGSGSLAAMAVLETGWRPGLGRDDAVALIAAAVRAGIFNDLGSGSNVDVCVIDRTMRVDYLRNYQLAAVKGPRAARHVPARGTTKILRASIKPIAELGVQAVPPAGAGMDIDRD